MISQVLLLAVVATVASCFEHHEPIHHAPKPYAFGYSIKDHHGEQHREESGTGGHAVKGSYGFTDARGVRRQVEYVADGAGFRANVKTNEPGTANQSPAAVHLVSDAHHPYGPGQGFLLTPGAGYGGLGYAGAGLGYAGAGLGYAGAGLGYAGAGAGLGYAGAGLGYAGAGLGYADAGLGYAGLGYGAAGLGYAGAGLGGLGYGGFGLGGLGYARYGY